MPGSSHASSGVEDKTSTPIQIREECKEYVALIERLPGLSQMQLEERACRFLIISAQIAEWKRFYEDQFILSSSAERAFFSNAVLSASGKNITEKKIMAEGNGSYQESKQKAEETNSLLHYLKTMYEIFTNAHIMYRQLSKGD